jgi:hypothetical protein
LPRVLSGSGPAIDQPVLTGQGILEGLEPQKIAEFAMDVLIEATSAPARKLTCAELSNLSKPALKALLHQRLTPGSSVELARALHRLGDTAAAAKALRAHPFDHYNLAIGLSSARSQRRVAPTPRRTPCLNGILRTNRRRG